MYPWQTLSSSTALRERGGQSRSKLSVRRNGSGWSPRSHRGSGSSALTVICTLITDSRVRVLPEASCKDELELEGPVELAEFDSGKLRWIESLKASRSRAFRGHAMAILRSTGKPGFVHVVEHSEGIESVDANLRWTWQKIR